MSDISSLMHVLTGHRPVSEEQARLDILSFQDRIFPENRFRSVA